MCLKTDEHNLAASLLLLLVLVKADVRDSVHLWFIHFLVLLGQRIPRDALEGLLYVHCLLGTRLEIGNIIFGLAPVLGSAGWDLEAVGDSVIMTSSLHHIYSLFFFLSGTHLSVFQVNLISNDDEREVLRVSWAGLNEELVSPTIESLEGVGIRDIVDKYAAICSSIECNSKTLEAFLTCRVPDLVRTRWETYGQTHVHTHVHVHTHTHAYTHTHTCTHVHTHSYTYLHGD